MFSAAPKLSVPTLKLRMKFPGVGEYQFIEATPVRRSNVKRAPAGRVPVVYPGIQKCGIKFAAELKSDYDELKSRGRCHHIIWRPAGQLD